MQEQRYIAAQEVGNYFEIQLNDQLSLEQIQQLLSSKINELIKTNFPVLVQLLYQMDVNELQLKQLLKEKTAEDAGQLIAGLLMERQWQKIQSRKQFPSAKNIDRDENEKW
jgi:hypothetical protein